MQKKTKVAIVLITIVAIISVSCVFASLIRPSTSTGGSISSNIPVLSPYDVTNKTIATQYGIQGYVNIQAPPSAPTEIVLENGTSTTITLSLTFVSFNSALTQTTVTLDPSSGYGLDIAQVYTTPNGNKVVDLDNIVTYSPIGTVVIKSGQTINVLMTISVPTDYPSGITIPLGPVGIWSDVQLVNNW